MRRASAMQKFGFAGWALALALCLSPFAAQALELVLVRADWCSVCERWEEEVGVGYAKTSESKIAPLRRVDFGAADLDSIDLAKRVDTTPTFLIIKDNVELGRMEGYIADHFFWGELGELLSQHSASQTN